jgi:hypothetical protein
MGEIRFAGSLSLSDHTQHLKLNRTTPHLLICLLALDRVAQIVKYLFVRLGTAHTKYSLASTGCEHCACGDGKRLRRTGRLLWKSHSQRRASKLLSNDAAHRRLPFGTRVRVCHNRCVTVRINDRGPFVRGRDIDLSPAAARAVGLGGTGHVTISRL